MGTIGHLLAIIMISSAYYVLHISLSVRERQILDYQTQQLKLLPLIASTYAFIQAGLYMLKLHFQCRVEIAEGDFKSLPEVGTL